MANPFAFPVTTAQVGNFFVGQYYQVLQQQPQLVHQFYNDSSTSVRIDGPARETATSMLQIHALVMSSNFTGIEITTAHCLESWTRGVLVMVSGSVQVKDLSGRRKFVQTFFLAPQENGYFIHNDIFIFIDEDSSHHVPMISVAQKDLDSGLNASSKQTDPVSNYVAVNEIQRREFVIPESKASGQVNGQSFSNQQVVHTSEHEKVPDNKSAQQTVGSIQPNAVHREHQSSMEETVGEPQKHTYASILRVAKGQSGPVVAHSQPNSNQNGHRILEQTHSSPILEQQPIESSNWDEGSQVQIVEEDSSTEKGEIKSVFVRNLPPTVSESEIEAEFKKFGEIKPDGVAVRSRKEVGVCYAFVEFQDLGGVHNAINAGSAQVGGRQVFIEERRPNNSVPVRGGRGRGRGIDQRGRFAPRSFGRGYGNAGNDRNYNRRNRTNGFYRPVMREEQGFSNGEEAPPSEVVQNQSE